MSELFSHIIIAHEYAGILPFEPNHTRQLCTKSFELEHCKKKARRYIKIPQGDDILCRKLLIRTALLEPETCERGTQSIATRIEADD